MGEVLERAIGSVLGLALGDALGAPFEFCRAHEIPSPVPAFELPWMGQAPGTWTDDTAMARNLWLSLIATDGRLDAADVLRRHLEWLATDPPDVGNQTRLALVEARRGTAEPARAVFERRGPEVSAGNGSVMYCAPLGVAYADRADRLQELAPTLSAITHWDQRCRTACLAVTVVAAALVRGVGGEEAVREALESVGDRDGGDELEFLVGAAGVDRPIDGPYQGFALFTAGVALRQAALERPFVEGLLEVVALGGDTDTNAAVTGSLLGAMHGRAALPPGWLDRLAEREAIEREAEALAELAAFGGSGPP